jgi:type IV pilus assembly protein PilB
MGLPDINNLQKNSQNNTTSTQVNSSNNILNSLVQSGKIDSNQASQIQSQANQSGQSVENVLMQQGLIDQTDMAKIKAESFNVPFVDINQVNLDPQLMQKIPQDVAKRNNAIVFEETPNSYKVAMADPLDLQKVKFLQTMLGKQVEPHYAEETALNSIIDTRYGAQVGEEVEEALEEVDAAVDINTKEQNQVGGDISNAPVSRIVNMILEYAYKFDSSDVHIEPREDKLSVRYRIHGVLSEKLTLPTKLIASIVSRIKILSDLKIDEHRIPQDGRFQIKVDTTLIDIRVSIMPTVYGEKVVMRLLERDDAVLPLEKTGLRGNAYKNYIEALKKTQGIILITGPTGSGKTQTLASSLNILNQPDVNIMTLENPVEIRINGVNQVQVNPDVGLTFAKGLRAFLRQDPDIIMIGEIRDQETAELAIQAALTGHLVLATLHTNSAAGALPRLLDMDVQPYLLSSTINVIVGQRLVRTLDPNNRKVKIASDQEVSQIQQVLSTIQGYDIFKVVGDEDKVELFEPVSSPQNPSGYASRTGIFEVMPVTEKIGQLVMAQKSTSEIQRQAQSEGMITMVQDGFMKAVEGITTVEEVLRVQH